MLVGVALVAEVLRELVHLLEAADDEPLEIQLVGDAEVEILAEQVRRRDERLGEPAAVARLQDRCLHLDEALSIEVSAHRGDHPRAQDGVATRILVHQQVEIAAPVASLDVGYAVERVGQRRLDPREHLERVDVERRLAALRLRGRAGDAYDVAEVDVDVPRLLRVAQKLDAPGAIDEIEEDELPHVPPSEHPPGEPPLRLRGDAVLERLGLCANSSDLVAIPEVLRRAHRRECTALDIRTAQSQRPERKSGEADLRAGELTRAGMREAHHRPRRTTNRSHPKERAGSAGARSREAGALPREKRAAFHAALMSMILNLSLPRGAATSTVSPFLRPMI